MLTALWNVSAAIRGYLRLYMPTNVVLNLLRRPPALKWAIPVSLAAAAAYLFTMSLCATMVERGAPGFLNVMVLVFFWNAVKFAWTALLAPVWIVHGAVGARREGECLVVRGQSEHAVAEASCS